MTCRRLVAVTCSAIPWIVAACGDTASDAANGAQADASEENGGVGGGVADAQAADGPSGASYAGDRGGGSGGSHPDTGVSGGVAGAAGTTVDAGAPRLFPVCQQDRYVEPSSDPACASLDGFTLVDLRIEDSDRNGSVVPGEEAFVSVSYTNGGTQDVNYPCIGLMADHPQVMFTQPNWPHHEVYYLATPGYLLQASFLVRFAPAIPSETEIHFTAWITQLESECIRGTAKLSVPVE